MMRGATASVLLATVFSILPGCAAPPSPPPEVTPERGERAALLEVLADKGDDLAKWRTTAERLRESLGEARMSLEERTAELALARRARQKLAEKREEAVRQKIALEQDMRRILESVAARELELVRRERQAIDEELQRLADSRKPGEANGGE